MAHHNQHVDVENGAATLDSSKCSHDYYMLLLSYCTALRNAHPRALTGVLFVRCLSTLNLGSFRLSTHTVAHWLQARAGGRKARLEALVPKWQQTKHCTYSRYKRAVDSTTYPAATGTGKYAPHSSAISSHTCWVPMLFPPPSLPEAGVQYSNY